MDIGQVVNCVSNMLSTSLASSSKVSYTRSWSLFRQCMGHLNIPYHGKDSLPLSINSVLMFIGYLQLRGYAPTSITSYVCAIAYIHKILGMPDPSSSYLVQKILAAAVKINPSADGRLPITLDILSRLIRAIPSCLTNPYLCSLFRAMCLVAFFGLMRVGELTSSDRHSNVLHFNQLHIHLDTISIFISKFKHNADLQPFELVLTRQRDVTLCPVTALHSYLSFRGRSGGPLFCLADLEPVPRTYFISKLNLLFSFCGLDNRFYKSHSFRIGAASFYASMGLSDEHIRLLGRWKSNAFRRYIRSQRVLATLPK